MIRIGGKTVSSKRYDGTAKQVAGAILSGAGWSVHEDNGAYTLRFVGGEQGGRETETSLSAQEVADLRAGKIDIQALMIRDRAGQG